MNTGGGADVDNPLDQLSAEQKELFLFAGVGLLVLGCLLVLLRSFCACLYSTCCRRKKHKTKGKSSSKEDQTDSVLPGMIESGLTGRSSSQIVPESLVSTEVQTEPCLLFEP